MANVIYSLFLPPVIWLLLGSPSLAYAGNLALFLVVVAHLYVVLWQEPLFALFQGDAFTYGFVARGINIVSLLINFVSCWTTIFLSSGRVEHLSEIPSIAWGVIGFSMLLTVTFPILTSRRVIALPRKDARREFENPGTGN